MIETHSQIPISTTEEHILKHPASLRVFLYALVPTVAFFNIYVAFSGRVLPSNVLILQQICFIIILFVKRSQLSDIKKILTYRYVIRFQIFIFGIYLIYMVGIKHFLEVSPWAFLFVLLVSLWMPDRIGGVITIFFNLCMTFLILWTDMEVFMAQREYLIRFDFVLMLFSLLVLSSTLIRRTYLDHLIQARSRLKASEQKYKDQSQRLMEEIAHRDRIEKRLHQPQLKANDRRSH